MFNIKREKINISVRNLVEFILRSGNIENSGGTGKDTEAMREGSRIHRKIQRQMGSDYKAEVSLSYDYPVDTGNNRFTICVEGRADGIFNSEETAVIDEIKGIYMDLSYLNEPIPIHIAQAKCYAYIYGKQLQVEEIGIQMTYCNLETEDIKRFRITETIEELSEWFEGILKEYSKWADWQLSWIKKRNASIKKAEFPFDYRNGQKELVTGVYKTILREKKLFIEAPTGVGKTISTVFPAVKAMGEEIGEKLFYLTAKTITRTVVEETFGILKNAGLSMKVVTITAKDKICIFDKADCNPDTCQRARGHYDRVNGAVFDLITNEQDISRDIILEYAQKHMVCPFEMCLDLTLFSDCIICDYNYAFDPNVYLKRFFANEKKKEYIFLIDEAHNLVERAREMYSACLFKQDFLNIKKLVQGRSKKLVKKLEICNKTLIKYKRECDEFEICKDITDFVLNLLRLMTEYEIFLQESTAFDGREKVLELYFNIKHFLNMYDLCGEDYIVYTGYNEDESFLIKLQCMDPSKNLKECLNKGRSAVFFSATMLPIGYYMEQLGGTEEDYAVYASSPFDKKKRLIMIGNDISTRYTSRNEKEYRKIAHYIEQFVGSKKGNYMVFFPSYRFMNSIVECMEENEEIDIVAQRSSMSEAEKEKFLEEFIEQPNRTRVGFCVMGGIFSEGIDLKNSRLIGAVIVGTGLPMVCNERELFRDYYDERKGMGFEYAYLYQGMNKVLQSAGRVIRTVDDIGAILLLDERFLKDQYQKLFPREWFPHNIVNINNVEKHLNKFWEENQNV